MTLPDRRELFGIASKPSSEVQRFLTEKPNARWQECLSYLLDNWPQAVNGRIEYLIEGGVAVKLLHPQRQEPGDVDVVSRDANMELAFRGSKRFGVKHLSLWYATRLWPYNTQAFESNSGLFLLDLHQVTEFQGREVLILNPLALAVSKTMEYARNEKRGKDILDLRLLNQDPKKIQELIDRIKAAYSQTKND